MKILDPTCGARSIWFDKDRGDVVYCDKRNEDNKLHGNRKWNIRPNVVHDYINMPFVSNYFDMVVFDPPHMTEMKVPPRLAICYGKLFANWRDNLRAGFSECFRVLRPGGTLIFKWNDREIPLKEILALAEYQPLFGHTTGSKSKTHWMCFVKGA